MTARYLEYLRMWAVIDRPYSKHFDFDLFRQHQKTCHKFRPAGVELM
jgi:hypothetical protein